MPGRCTAKVKSSSGGKRQCRNKANQGKRLCWQHMSKQIGGGPLVELQQSKLQLQALIKQICSQPQNFDSMADYQGLIRLSNQLENAVKTTAQIESRLKQVESTLQKQLLSAQTELSQITQTSQSPGLTGQASDALKNALDREKQRFNQQRLQLDAQHRRRLEEIQQQYNRQAVQQKALVMEQLRQRQARVEQLRKQLEQVQQVKPPALPRTPAPTTLTTSLDPTFTPKAPKATSPLLPPPNQFGNGYARGYFPGTY